MYFFRTLRPVRLELGLTDRGVANDLRVADGEIITRTGFVELLLDGKPGRFIEPDLNFRNLIPCLRGLWS